MACRVMVEEVQDHWIARASRDAAAAPDLGQNPPPDQRGKLPQIGASFNGPVQVLSAAEAAPARPGRGNDDPSRACAGAGRGHPREQSREHVTDIVELFSPPRAMPGRWDVVEVSHSTLRPPTERVDDGTSTIPAARNGR